MPSFWWSADKPSLILWYRVDLPNRRASKIKDFEGHDVDDLAETIKEREQLACPASTLVIKAFAVKKLEDADENSECGGEVVVDEDLLREFGKDFGQLALAYGIDDQNPLVVRLPDVDKNDDLYYSNGYDTCESFDRESTIFSDHSIPDQPDMTELSIDLVLSPSKYERHGLMRSLCSLQASFLFFEPRWDEQQELQLHSGPEPQVRARRKPRMVGRTWSAGGLVRQGFFWFCGILIIFFWLYYVMFKTRLAPSVVEVEPEVFGHNFFHDKFLYYIGSYLSDVTL